MKSRIHAALAAASVAVLALTSATRPAHADELVNVTCGARGQRPCLLLPYPDTGWLRGGLRADGCDRGLISVPEICFWDTWLGKVPYPCKRCRNFVRESVPRCPDHLVRGAGAGRTAAPRQGRTDQLVYPGRLTQRVQRIQRRLRRQSKSALLPDGSTQSRVEGAVPRHSRVVHRSEAEPRARRWIALPTDRHVVMALREIREWIQSNPGEIVVLMFEDYWGDDNTGRHEFVQGLRNQLGQWILRVNEKPPGRWPTGSEMLARGRQIVVRIAYCADSETL